jgi:hypothetical protein
VLNPIGVFVFVFFVNIEADVHECDRHSHLPVGPRGHALHLFQTQHFGVAPGRRRRRRRRQTKAKKTTTTTSSTTNTSTTMAANVAVAQAAIAAAAAAHGANINNAAAAAAAGGGGRTNNNNNTNEHVEFSVRAAEDLYLEGSLKTIRRVTADTNYSCLMLKTQRFSSLFRHYAKYHGLRKDDLQYHFVNVLKNDDTPESVQLQRNDVIIVRIYNNIDWRERNILALTIFPIALLANQRPRTNRSRRSATTIGRL